LEQMDIGFLGTIERESSFWFVGSSLYSIALSLPRNNFTPFVSSSLVTKQEGKWR
jgi:hypothetical protein